MLRLLTFGGLHLEIDGVRRTDLDSQPQLLALLTVLASAGERGVSRAAVVRIFWPHSVKGSDRTALSAALYRLRGILGADIVEGAETLSLKEASLSCDLLQFEACIAGRQFEQAVKLYEGEFLLGFSLRAADNFNQWAEEQRARLALECRHALEALVSAAQERGDGDAAVTSLRRLVKHAPHDSGALKRLEHALAGAAVRSPHSASAAPPAQPYIGGPSEPALGTRRGSSESERRRWRGVTRVSGLYLSLAAAAVAVAYGIVRLQEPAVQVVTPLHGDSVAVFTTVAVETPHEDLWIWIRWSGMCWMRGPFTRLEDGRQTLLAQFGETAEQSGFPYWFVVLAGPKLAPYQRVEDRRLPDCRYELLDPDAWSDTVLVYRR